MKKGLKLNIWGAASANKKISLQIFEEIFDAEKY